MLRIAFYGHDHHSIYLPTARLGSMFRYILRNHFQKAVQNTGKIKIAISASSSRERSQRYLRPRLL
ncbi:unnamed protein product [Chrysoparadoxa australica]